MHGTNYQVYKNNVLVEIQLLKQNHNKVEQKFNRQIAKAKLTYEKKLVSLDADFKMQLSKQK